MTDTVGKPVRSPSHPSMPLREAIDHVRKIEAQYRLSPVGREVAAKMLGYKGLSGPASQSLAALAQYGLVDRAGKGDLRVTPRARAILHPIDEAEHKESLWQAALEPQLYRELFERFPGIIPPEDGLISYLNRQGFNQSAIRGAARAFIQTLNFLQDNGISLSGEGVAASLEEETSFSSTPKYGGAKIGDLVQWESDGVLHLPQPARVRQISPDGQWVAVHGSQTGIPMSQVIVEARASGDQPVPPIFPLEETDATSVLRAGETEWMRSRLGAQTNFRLLVDGPLGPREINRLIKLLNAQKEVLEEDE